MVEARVDLVTTDNLGVLPSSVVAELAEPLDDGRPFLASTLRLDAPIAGMGLTIPLVVVNPTAGKQEDEKDVLTHTATRIEPVTFDPTTVGGYGDASFPLLQRSDPSYRELYLGLLAEAYGESADAGAINALLAAGGVTDGGTFDPAEFRIGEAVIESQAAARRLPDTLWLSTAAVWAIVDAKAPGSNVPMYPSASTA